MKSTQLFAAIGNIGDKFVCEDAEASDTAQTHDRAKSTKVTQVSRWAKWLVPAAACLAIAVAAVGLPRLMADSGEPLSLPINQSHTDGGQTIAPAVYPQPTGGLTTDGAQPTDGVQIAIPADPLPTDGIQPTDGPQTDSPTPPPNPTDDDRGDPPIGAYPAPPWVRFENGFDSIAEFGAMLGEDDTRVDEYLARLFETGMTPYLLNKDGIAAVIDDLGRPYFPIMENAGNPHIDYLYATSYSECRVTMRYDFADGSAYAFDVYVNQGGADALLDEWRKAGMVLEKQSESTDDLVIYGYAGEYGMRYLVLDIHGYTTAVRVLGVPDLQTAVDGLLKFEFRRLAIG
jgi:hypothetical protein